MLPRDFAGDLKINFIQLHDFFRVRNRLFYLFPSVKNPISLSF